MKNTMKIGLLSLVAGLALQQSACAPYYTTVEGEWVIEEEIEVIEPVQYFDQEHLVFNIRWNESGINPDLISSLITPFGALIDDGSPELDGCYFLGTYDESWNERVSTIDCVNPFHGMYDLEIENIGFMARDVSIEVIKEYQNGHTITQQISTQEITVYSGDATVIHYNF